MATLLPVSAQVVANAFVQQYYHILHHSPALVFRFYQDVSKLGRPEDDGSMSITTTMQGINDKIVSLNYADMRAVIRCVDAQDSLNGGVHVLVTGYLTEKGGTTRNFAQTFFLAPQEKGFFVLNDMFRYLENVSQHTEILAPANDVVALVTLEQNHPTVVEDHFSEQGIPPAEEANVADHPPVLENHISEQSIPLAEEENVGEVYNPPESEDVPVVEEKLPVVKVVDEVQADSSLVVESNIKIEEVPKKSYASIVMHLNDSVATFSTPPPGSRKSVPVPKAQEPVNQSSAVVTNGSVSNSDAVENGHNHEGEASEGYSIYIKDLPMNANHAMLQEEFKRFGPIKIGGIQVRRIRGFCFGFVEFETASAVEKALEASPIEVGGQKAVVEEKRSTNGRGNRGRFLPGRGYGGFRNDGMMMRGRGAYGGGRGYGRNDFGRNEFVPRGGYRGGMVYQRADSLTSNGDRVNRPAGMTPRVSATA